MRFILLSLLWACAAQAAAFDKSPSPELEPMDVLEIVLAGMASNDYPQRDAGLQQAFRFASPDNKSLVGPFWHFKAVVLQPQYAPLINHIKRTFGNPVTTRDTSTIPLVVVSNSGEVAGYMWMLALQEDGEHKGSWMTDAVKRVVLSEDLKAL